jgi:CheY-like chemotaxis protein
MAAEHGSAGVGADGGRLVRILLVEDSPDDVLLTREALREAKFANHLDVVDDGDAAMRFLRKEEPFQDAARPDLILLDLNLPGKDGREVLEDVKGDPMLRQIPVVILTTSASDRDVLRAYDHHVNAYVRKPIDLDCFVDVVQAIDGYWLGIVTLPPA